MQRYTVFFIAVNAVHVRRVFRPSSGALTVHTVAATASDISKQANGGDSSKQA